LGTTGGGRKRLSLIQMILLRHLKAGFGKKGWLIFLLEELLAVLSVRLQQ
jgi:hypothetical protein